MSQDSAMISERLSNLESSMNALSEQVSRVRIDDFKRAVIGEIVEALSEEGKRLMERGSAMEGFSLCQSRDYCRETIDDTIRMALDSFYRCGPDSAISILSEFEERMAESEECVSPECQQFAINVLKDAQVSFSIARRMQERMESMGAITVEPGSQHLREDLSDILALLSNGHRLKILEALYEAEKCFSDLSEATGLRTGHLQFHIQSLQDKGAVRRTPIRGVYAITVLGMTMMEGVQEFDARLNSLRPQAPEEA